MTGAQIDLDLLRPAVDILLGDLTERESRVFKELEHSGATRLVNALRLIRVQRSVLAIGAFSLYESLLQSEFDMAYPFRELPERLKRIGQNEAADKFMIYYYAVNTLKHGKGSSHNSLIKKPNLDFLVKTNAHEWFFEEGDVSEGQSLINVDTEFVSSCLTLIDETLAILREAPVVGGC